MLSKLAQLATNRPKRVLLIAAFVSVISLVVSNGLPQQLAAQGFDNKKAESARAVDQISAAAGFDPSQQIVALVTAPDGKQIDTPAGRELTASAAKKLEGIEGVKSVTTPFADGTPPAVARLAVSEDGTQAVVVTQMAPGAEESDAAADAVAAFEGEESVQLGGGLVAQDEVSATVSEDLARSELIVFPLLFLISLFVFRSLIAAALPLLVGAITIPVTMAMISGYNQVTSLSVFALNLTTGLGLGLAIDYALLTITRYREELAAGAEPARAIATTLNTAGRTIIYSSLTVAGSVLVLGIFPLKFLYSMAFAGATVAIASAVVSLTVLPAVLILLGRNLDRFSLARKPVENSTARWYRLANGVMDRPVLVALAVTMLIVVLTMPVRNVDFTSVDATVLPKDNSAHIVQVAQAEDFPKGQSSTIFIAADAPKSGAEKIAELRKEVLAVDGVSGAAQPVYLGRDTWSFDVYTEQLFYDSAALDAVDDIRALDTATAIKVGGNSAVFVDQRATILDRVPLALLLILVITFIVLFLMTGSVVLPLKTFIMNIFTLAATFGILTWIFGQGNLEGLLGYTSQDALEMTQPVLLFVIAFALATDYGVFLLGRIKELRDQGLDNRESVAQGLAKTGRVITSAALLFCVAIGAFSLSGIVFIKQLGIGTAVAVAIDATLIRALLVPALMAMLGEYNWWAPRWMKRIYRRFGLSEGPSAPGPEPAAAAG
ncbi:MAG: MMPL family transporter [Thermoleophilaceae bacterium]|nr:MMPL family transporter [Thermoleophilaceae bacterium]